ncbi:MAG TPA: hypothetical protein VKB50_14285 [Vicinamibacterales bacterium]|nr:hypothetical protein [Vicinamibacterales bacterium]
MSARSSDQALTRALRALADAEARVETPAHVETAIMALWDARHDQAQTAPTRRRIVRGAAAIAAGVTIVGSVALQRDLADRPIAPPRSPAISFDRAASPRVAPAISDAADTPAPGAADRHPSPGANDARSALVVMGDPIATGEIVHIVRMRVMRSALTELGIAANASTEMVDVDVLVGEDGVARGLRVSL